jgi:glycosyltransferase involved in cell wall biosynthesis
LSSPHLEEHPLKIALVLWGGGLGGAEIFMGDLAVALKSHGAEPHVVFVLEAEELAERLDRSDVPYTSLGLRRGRTVLRSPRSLARAILETKADVAVLTATGYLAATAWAGGFRYPIIGVEHGSLLQLPQMGGFRRTVYRADRLSGLRACSAVVAVSEYVKDRLELVRFRRRVVCIPNGVDLARFSPPVPVDTTARHERVVVGSASRLAPGKGIADAIEMLAHRGIENVYLRIAGEGPERAALEALATSHSLEARVDFLGPVIDMPGFWRSVDLGIVPSHELVEGFGMVAIEAMACGKPVVVSNNGALPEVVVDGKTGRVASAGDPAALAETVAGYVRNPTLRLEHGRNARKRCEDLFGIDRCAFRYLELCADVVGVGAPRQSTSTGASRPSLARRGTNAHKR